MRRLIDAKPLMQSGWHLVQTGECNRFIQSMSLADIPTVDAEEVVRCKDCKHRAIGDNVCIHPNRIGDGYIEVKDNDFCSYGERREGE